MEFREIDVELKDAIWEKHRNVDYVESLFKKLYVASDDEYEKIFNEYVKSGQNIK